MKVIDLIIALQQLPQDLPVMFDATPPNAEMFKLGSVDDIEEVSIDKEDGSGETEIVLLSCGAKWNGNSDN